ncbi:MAG: pyrroline-5-carboxylate reductase [Proteobacteria bacterium]|nr:pyrroline-5-carboxylate reductase [Pseudomonadota bacterium]
MIEELSEQRVGFIGCGAMAQALAGGLVAAGLPAERILGSDPDPGSRVTFEKSAGAATRADNEDVVAESDLVVLAVKPAVVVPALEALAGSAALDERLWISIAAGVPIAALEGALPDGARVVRAMPNTPALVGAAATALCANPHATDADRAAASALFSAVGTTWEAPNEAMLDAVTGLSGSGPAYVFLFLEALGDAGVRVGLPREAAFQLAFQTVYGAAKLALESGLHPAALKDRVCSPGGTTIAGLERLEALGVRAALYEAVAAATARSRELGS